MGAKEAYIKGFHASHPKVAWALEGLGKIHEKERKEGSLEAALKCYHEAAKIRQDLQSKDSSKEMFTKELAYLEERRLALNLSKMERANARRPTLVAGRLTADRSQRGHRGSVLQSGVLGAAKEKYQVDGEKLPRRQSSAADLASSRGTSRRMSMPPERSTKKVSMDEALSMSRRSDNETKTTSMFQALQEAARAASPPPPPLAEDVDATFKTSTPASIHPAPASAAEPTQTMSMDERLSQARHSKGAPSLTSLTSPRVLRPEEI